MKIAVIGSRDGFTKEEIYNKLDKSGFIEKIITGGARGVDTYAERYAYIHRIECEIIRPENPSIKYDYLKRNMEIINKCDKAIAFWDGKSKGTKFTIDYCKRINKEIEIVLRVI